MTAPFHSPRDARAVLGTWSGAERLAIESALTDVRLEGRLRRRMAAAARRAVRRSRRSSAQAGRLEHGQVLRSRS
jgi:hypothetical protein